MRNELKHTQLESVVTAVYSRATYETEKDNKHVKDEPILKAGHFVYAAGQVDRSVAIRRTPEQPIAGIPSTDFTTPFGVAYPNYDFDPRIKLYDTTDSVTVTVARRGRVEIFQNVVDRADDYKDAPSVTVGSKLYYDANGEITSFKTPPVGSRVAIVGKVGTVLGLLSKKMLDIDLNIS